MHVLSLQIGKVGDVERHDESLTTGVWEPIMSAQAGSKTETKSLMLENLLEALNDEQISIDINYLRLAHYVDGTITEIEVF